MELVKVIDHGGETLVLVARPQLSKAKMDHLRRLGVLNDTEDGETVSFGTAMNSGEDRELVIEFLKAHAKRQMQVWLSAEPQPPEGVPGEEIVLNEQL